MWSTCCTVFFEIVVWLFLLCVSGFAESRLSSCLLSDTLPTVTSLHCILCSLGHLGMAGKVFGPEFDDAESVLGTRNVLRCHCCKCAQTLDACWLFQHTYT